jgi:predicted ABC-type ATPase
MAETEPPQIIIIAGPNGAGKSTSAPDLLPEGVAFINADEIAKSLPGFPSSAVDMQAGRLLLERLEELAGQRADFAIETTLASRALASRIVKLKAAGYRIHLLFIWLSSADLAIERVAERVRRGGHSIPEATIRRRYAAGLRNLVQIYIPLVDTWRVIENVRVGKPRLIAFGQAGSTPIGNYSMSQTSEIWKQIENEAQGE